MPNEAQWQLLIEELDRWVQAGRVASMWWRDDDAVADTAELRHLLGCSAAKGVPLAVAVVPVAMQSSLPKLLDAFNNVTVLPHGLSHTNSAPPTEKKSEFGPNRDMQAARLELRRARVLISTHFRDKAASVFVPPWNRIADACVQELVGSGFVGLSCFGPRHAVQPVPGLTLSNCHVDIIDWRGSRGFVGIARAVEALIGHLAARRMKSVDAAEPTGVLTHHLMHDIACWSFLEELTVRLEAHPGQQWISVSDWLQSR